MRPHALLLLAAAAGTAAPTGAQQLAVQKWSVRDGLAHSRVNCMFEDRRGYVWLGTWEGLSRFDGRSFVNFGTADGLPNPFVNCIAEDRDGALWVGTLGGGIARLGETRAADGTVFTASSIATVPRANDVFGLVFAAPGAWIATAAGVYRATWSPAGASFELALRHDKVACVAACDAGGAPVFFRDTLAAAVRDGALASAPWPADPGLGAAVATLPDGDGFLLAFERGLVRALPPFGATAPVAVPAPLQADEEITALARDRGGSLWVATNRGLLEHRGALWHRFDVRHGLPDDSIRCLFVDREDGLWIGTFRGGVARLYDRTAVTFAAREGFIDSSVARVVAAGGTIYATTHTSGQYEVRGDHVVRVPGPAGSSFATAHRRLHRDGRGDFWIGTDDGQWYCPAPDFDAAHCRLLGADDGLPVARICAEVQETEDGTLWVCTIDGGVFCRDRAADTWHAVVAMSDLGDATPCRLVADWRGQPVLASFDHLWRRDGASWRRLPLGGSEPLRPRSVYRDRDGWMWVGTRFRGLFAEPPSGDTLHLDTADGLASDAVWAIAEDERGRLYFGTARGISTYDKHDGRLRPFAGDLLRDPVNHLLCDRDGRLWAATASGLSRFDLGTPVREHAPPRVYVADVRIDGERMPLPVNGAAAVGDLVLAPAQRSLEVVFVAVALPRAGSPRYQHRLVGIDADWSAPSEVSTLRFANLAAGDYRVRVRAVDADGAASTDAAELAFTVLPPFWRRAWFVAAAALACGAVAFAWHRLRLQRAVATERLRTQIATDLHDDVGAGLAQIAILSEVARRAKAPEPAASLGEIAQLARTLREAMGDIVWALARGHDSLADLVQRMRQLCARLLEVDGVEVAFAAPPAEQLAAVRLSLEQRRQLWLWFREALTNVARHARARRVDVELALAPRTFRLRVRDDGAGFAAASTPRGNGLASMQSRGERLGATMHVDSAPGAGTTLTLDVPLTRSPRRSGA